MYDYRLISMLDTLDSIPRIHVVTFSVDICRILAFGIIKLSRNIAYQNDNFVDLLLSPI